MPALLTHLSSLAHDDPRRPAIICDQTMLCYGALWQEVQALADCLTLLTPRCMAVDIAQPVSWLISDLALIAAGYPSIPFARIFYKWATASCHA